MPQTYYLGGRSPLVTASALLLWACALALAAWVGWLGSTAPAWLIAAAGVAVVPFAATAAGLWWRLAWARLAGVACLLAAGALGLAMSWHLLQELPRALLVALPLAAGLAWLARRLVSRPVRQQFLA